MTNQREPVSVLRRFYNWITLEDYEIAKGEATDLVVKRLSRGNTSTQNGWYLDSNELANLSKAGDEAVRNLSRRAPV